MDLTYGIDANEDIHLLALIKWMIDGLIKKVHTRDTVIENYGQTAKKILDLLYEEFDDCNTGYTFAAITSFLEEIGNYLQGKSSSSVYLTEYQEIWSKVKSIYFNPD
jgi:hypothetical protein